MKKTYKKPATETIRVNLCSLMANSLHLSNQAADINQGMLSREAGGDLWDEE